MNWIFACLLVILSISANQCATDCHVELDMDFRGVPYPNDLIYEGAASFQACCALCNSVQECKAWTFVFETKVCVLKTAVGLKVPTQGSNKP